MLKLRNLSLLRRLYVWGLAFITRVAYGPELRTAPHTHTPFRTDEQRIRRINSELEFGPRAWQKTFLTSSAQASTSGTSPAAFQLEDIAAFISDGVEAIVGDTLTTCFTAEPPEPWNFLTRNIPPGKWQMSPYNTLLWVVGIWARYCVLLPLRVTAIVLGILSFSFMWPMVSVIPKLQNKRAARKFLLRYLSSVFVASWSGYVKFHGQRPCPRPNQIYVANHTSLIDLFILSKDYNFSCIGQRHSGLAGFLQLLLMTAQDHVWFDREEGRDRRAVQQLLRDHVADGSKEPMLVFPEGTCTNSQYCIMFKKGSFELGATVYPIAMRYRHRFGDPFWNSQTTSFPRHLFDLTTSWAVVCDVYYMEPETMKQGENAVQFANRVKKLICERAGLTSVNWDGFLKRHRISPRFMESRQRALASIVTRRLNGELPRAVSSSVLTAPDGGHPQTGNVHDGAGAGGMDTLGIEKPLMRQTGGGEGTEAGRTGGLYREVVTLRKRLEGPTKVDWARRPVGRVRQWIVTAFQDAFRWTLGIGLLVVAAVVTSRFMPQSWKAALTSGWT